MLKEFLQYLYSLAYLAMEFATWVTLETIQEMKLEESSIAFNIEFVWSKLNLLWSLEILGPLMHMTMSHNFLNALNISSFPIFFILPFP